MAYALKKRAKMAKGGEVKGVHKPLSATSGNSAAGQAAKSHANIHPYAQDKEMIDRKEGHKQSAMAQHRNVVDEMRAMPKPNLPMAEGGEVSGDERDADMIARIMHKRKCYSEGGVVANDVGVAEADKLPAEYDDLVLDDHLEDDSSAGNEIGDDVVSRAMKKRKK